MTMTRVCQLAGTEIAIGIPQGGTAMDECARRGRFPGIMGGMALTLLWAAGCSTQHGGGGYNSTGILPGPSKSGTVAITADDQYVLMVNPEDDSVSVFSTGGYGGSPVRTVTVKTGDEPSSVVIDPDDDTAYVANRADATVVKITGIRSDHPYVSDPVEVGSEPTGIALSPTGAYLYVAEFAEGRVSTICTYDMVLHHVID